MKNYRALEIASVVWIYSAMVLVAILGELLASGSFLDVWQSSASPISARAFFWAGILVITYFCILHIMPRLFNWATEVEKILHQVLTPMSYFQMVLLAAVGAFIEEWFFRGYLLPRMGIILSSIFFAAAHLLPGLRPIAWIFLNFFLGISFALLYKSSGSLILVAIVHTVINLNLLVYLNGSTRRASFS